jgi:ferrous iron transport protein B
MNHTEGDIRLSDLSTGEEGIIIKIQGHGAFRKRITEMGFVKGKKIKVIKNAPLQDPVEYELMGYRVTLRHAEAALIEVVAGKELAGAAEPAFTGTLDEESINKAVIVKSRTISVALVGNPNSGKTTLFNYATGKHERVGNYSGVTVDMKEAQVKQNNYFINITDLPGTYSISEYSPEELYVRRFIAEKAPDVVVNVVDASNLERNLFLTTQLIDMNIRVVMALNMYDELESKGDKFDFKSFGKITGIPVIPTVASKGKGLTDLFNKVIEIYEGNEPVARHTHINYGQEIEESIKRLRQEILSNKDIPDLFYSRHLALKLLENEKTTRNYISGFDNTVNILNLAQREIARLEKIYSDKSETIIADAKYGFINGALKETYKVKKTDRHQISHSIDTILTGKYLGLPIFFFFLWLMFQLTFTLGSYPMAWIDEGVGALSNFIRNAMPEGSLRDLIVDGIFGGVGGVIVFLPNILILFFCISLMEDTGYMARAAFIMDKLMHKIGLHGKSFIPLIMGFGCNVPAIMATRTLENRKDRILTMLIIPFMSCSARLPVYVLLISAFFPENQGVVLLSLYTVGIIIAILMALLFKKIFFSKKDIPFVMELPPYRVPTLRNTATHMWDKSGQYLKKMGTVILAASVIIWALGHYPVKVGYSKDYDAMASMVQASVSVPDSLKQKQLIQIENEKQSEHMEKSYIGKIGQFIEPTISPLGFDWKIGVSIVTGLAAKEIVVGSMGVMYQSGHSIDASSVSLKNKLKNQVYSSGPRAGKKIFTPLSAFSLMLFVLIYFPCAATLSAIKKEAGTGWALFAVFYTTAVAWLVSFAVFQLGSLFI